MSDLQGKRALVTGASRGIGAAIALTLARRGADIAITYERSSDRAAEVVRSIQALGRKAIAIQADSADPEAVKRSVAEAVQGLGGLDILVNNAGIGGYGMVANISLSTIDNLLYVNVRSVVLATQAALPHLGPGGRIITIGSSLAERVPFPGATVYAMSKSALLAFTRGLSREVGSQQITVNLVQPGPIDTEMNPANSTQAAGISSLTGLGRYGSTEEVAATVAFLASPAADYITGSVLTVDGGGNA